MNRRYILGALALILAAVTATMIIRCQPFTLAGSFSYAPYQRPQGFVAHPRPGRNRLRPDAMAEVSPPVTAATVSHARKIACVYAGKG